MEQSNRLLPRGYAGPIVTDALRMLDKAYRPARCTYDEIVDLSEGIDLVRSRCRIRFSDYINMLARLRRDFSEYPLTPAQQQLFSAMYFSLEMPRSEVIIAFAFPWADDALPLSAYVHGAIQPSRAAVVEQGIDAVASALYPAFRDAARKASDAQRRMASLENPPAGPEYGLLDVGEGKPAVYRRQVPIEELID